MSGVSGKEGTAKIGSSAIAEVTKWDFKPKSNNGAWASNSSSGYKVRVGGSKDGGGSIEVKLDPSDPFYAVLDVGTEVALKLYTTSTLFYDIPAIIESYDIKVDIDSGEPTGATISFETNGAWTNPA